MKRLLEYSEEGDTVMVWRVDRLGRSLIDVLTVNLLARTRRKRPIHRRRHRPRDLDGAPDAEYARNPRRV